MYKKCQTTGFVKFLLKLCDFSLSVPKEEEKKHF
jgi:hypothetical protein